MVPYQIIHMSNNVIAILPKRSLNNELKWDQAERQDLKSHLFYSLPLFSSFLKKRGKKKGRMNSKNRDFKSCLSAWSHSSSSFRDRFGNFAIAKVVVFNFFASFFWFMFFFSIAPQWLWLLRLFLLVNAIDKSFLVTFGNCNNRKNLRF